MLGIPTGRLFTGLLEANLELLYADPVHLNFNGQKYFTSLITPHYCSCMKTR
jgi:hypothetical protein